MGNYKTKNKDVDVTKMQRISPQNNYEIKTRPPLTEGNSWKENIQLRVRQQQLADQAMPVARKCYEPSMDYINCTQKQGLFWMVFNCQQEFYYVAECQQHQFYVQMDKRRRDMKRNPEKWWRQLYDENGEVGRQKQMQFGELNLLDSVKFTFLGQQAIKDKKFYYGKPQWFKKNE